MSDLPTQYDLSSERTNLTPAGESSNSAGNGTADNCTDGQTASFPSAISILAQHSDNYLTEETLALGFRVSARTIRRWEKSGVFPPRTPGLRMWRVGSVQSWLIERAEVMERSVKSRLKEEQEFMED